MNKVIELRKIINSSLQSIHPRVYFQDASKDVVFPYLVFDLPNSNDDGTLELFVLDVDGWDTPPNRDTTALETLMNDADNALHRKTFTVNDELSVTFYRDNRLTLMDDDKRIIRRKYTYQARVFERR